MSLILSGKRSHLLAPSHAEAYTATPGGESLSAARTDWRRAILLYIYAHTEICLTTVLYSVTFDTDQSVSAMSVGAGR